MQCILKKLGYNHLYEHIPYIINKLSNLPPPKISGQTEQRFLKMFMIIYGLKVQQLKYLKVKYEYIKRKKYIFKSLGI